MHFTVITIYTSRDLLNQPHALSVWSANGERECRLNGYILYVRHLISLSLSLSLWLTLLFRLLDFDIK